MKKLTVAMFLNADVFAEWLEWATSNLTPEEISRIIEDITNKIIGK